MADIETIQVGTTERAIYDSTKIRTSHVHEIAHYQGYAAWPTGKNSTYNTSTTVPHYANWGFLFFMYGGFKNGASISVSAQGQSNWNERVGYGGNYTTIQNNGSNYTLWCPLPAHGMPLFSTNGTYINRYQVNKNGDIFFMATNGTGSARTIEKSQINETYGGCFIGVQHGVGLSNYEPYNIGEITNYSKTYTAG